MTQGYSNYGNVTNSRACYSVGQVVMISNGLTDVSYTCTSIDILSPAMQVFFSQYALPCLVAVQSHSNV